MAGLGVGLFDGRSRAAFVSFVVGASASVLAGCSGTKAPGSDPPEPVATAPQALSKIAPYKGGSLWHSSSIFSRLDHFQFLAIDRTDEGSVERDLAAGDVDGDGIEDVAEAAPAGLAFRNFD